MKNKNYDEQTLLDRRYRSIVKARKEWFCDRCSERIEKGAFVEHSDTPDMRGAFELCVSCADIFDVLKKQNIEV